ncbi:type IV toxin-antitoxin system AbiEi family antitoxin domain-containing protein [Microbacterium sp. OVT16B]|uniref:type IV toxin-antitoxin system AbiEi family antitoxin domain-containing protein n=1 Tax=Microbacterium TaxID=33882 RepID=UPI0035AB9BCA
MNLSSTILGSPQVSPQDHETDHRASGIRQSCRMPEKKRMLDRLRELHRIQILSRNDLREAGLSTHAITRAVRGGRLTRIRNGVYAVGDVPEDVQTALHVGGRISCVSLLRLLGIFVLEATGVHIQVRPHLSRSRDRRPPDAVLHWVACDDVGLPHAVSIDDAVRQSIRCQAPRAAIATLDSVLHHRLLTREHLVSIFQGLPERYRPLLALVDGIAESGPESFMKLILRTLGVRFEMQVEIQEVGRADFVVEGWLIIECDSREFHQGWDQQMRDRARDLGAARLGYVCIRVPAMDIFTRQGEVREAIRAVIVAFGPRWRGTASVPKLRRSGRGKPRSG